MKRNKWIGLFVLFGLSIFADNTQAQLSSLFRRGPSIQEISTDELAAMLAQRGEPVQQDRVVNRATEPVDFVLVDVRSKAEVNVSVIPGAITKAEFERNRRMYRGLMVIPYCTVGGRSGDYARQLAKSGVQVKNYRGSILEWAQHKLPLVTLDGQPTNRVHTYSSRYRVPREYQAVTR
jgi:rhodanese-related sulfurtransferase